MSESKRPSGVLDSNVYVSALLTGGPPRTVIGAWRSGRFEVMVSVEQREELHDVLIRPKLVTAFTFSDFTAGDMLAALAADAIIAQPAKELPVHSRDVKDDPILATALGGNADYLVTGDKDLQTLNGHPALGKLRIISPAEFLRELGL